MYSIEQYNISHYSLWNDFIAQSKNGTFLFHRDYMEYHSDRFEDFSLLIFEGKKLIAVFPANRERDVVYSHKGLTYGGLVLGYNISYEKIKLIFSTILQYSNSKKILRFLIKTIPCIYYRMPSYEIEAILYTLKSKLLSQNMNLAIDLIAPFSISKSKKKHYRRIDNIGLEIRKDNNFSLFWEEVLIPRLKMKYGAKPVHTLEEILLLHNRFPENIIQYNVYYNNIIVSGITIFKFPNGIKSQYGATTDQGEKVRALDYLFISLIEKYKTNISFFDMGIINDETGYNSGLLKQKEELGCSVFIQNFYEVDTANFHLLDNALI